MFLAICDMPAFGPLNLILLLTMRLKSSVICSGTS
ncbi:hypothetical protein WN66_04600 [Saccharomyces cerevisiae]|uniref:Putative uncharacterized protein YLR399W-A n=2 Tax=Saccharomyces cerevisiae TaxID=4932 RepID=YL399_YEAST|nr:RecName: Full=Putative uncharacterized protein YLR399W-A [Saccharomyces cerevisiae S288C]AAL79282.1 unknown [Saccharomyces cerevisiae]KZV09651.1 hypothetical protein WN66_04600 [Saccharomyces cerevisiae]WNV73111.1 hypothetical protein O6U65_1996 [Saccharomyces cerevisiae synthetic construct]CAY81625.1 EC1118_1L7_2773p [Saccharomyces cerevisiae EC1118]